MSVIFFLAKLEKDEASFFCFIKIFVDKYDFFCILTLVAKVTKMQKTNEVRGNLKFLASFLGSTTDKILNVRRLNNK